MSEWYNEQNQELFEYFESWDDLKYKIENTSHEYINNKKQKIKTFIENSNTSNIEKWKNILKIGKILN